MPKPITGTVICGTLRPQDLIPAFLDALRVVAPDAYAQVVCAPFGVVPADVNDGDSSAWWDGEDAAALLESLFDALNENAPDGYYFGALDGDGSDFGFWPSGE
jgi:hypothetical protein